MPLNSPTADLLPKAYDETPITSLVTRLPSANLAKVAAVEVVFSGGLIRYLVTGANPTQGVGIPAYDGDRRVLTPIEANKLRMILVGTESALVRATYYYHA